MAFKYTTAIHKIRQMKARIKIIPGGSSAGKTYSIIPILIDKAIRNPNLTISIVSESIPHLRKGAMKDFLSIMKETNRYNRNQWNITNSVYTFTNGSTIEFFSVENEQSVRGPRRTDLYINECNKITFEVYNQLAMRTSGDIYLDYNPSHRFWVDDIMDQDNIEKLTLTYKDNEALPKTVVEFLESHIKLAETSDYWKNWCNVYLYGLPGSLEGVIFNNWKTIDTIPDEATLLGYGLDFGFTNDPTACVGLYKYEGKLLLDEVIYGKGLLNSEIAAILKEEPRADIYADSAEPKSIQEIKNYSLPIFPAKKGADSIMAGIALVQEYEMLVTKKSNNLIRELENYSWKTDANGNATNSPIDTYNHIIDGLRYIVTAKMGKKRVDTGTLYSEVNVTPMGY